jgi:peptide/nickel transport system permease protein
VLILAVVGIVRISGAERLVLLVVLLAGTSWMPLARVVRAEVQSLVHRDFVVAARALGLTPVRIVVVHVVPHVVPFVLVYGALAIGHAILAEATLSYLGLGVSAPTASWGSLVAEGASAIRRAPWLVLAPGLSITLLVLAFNALADALRDAFDPHRRGGGNFTRD